MSLRNEKELYNEDTEKIKDIIIIMNGLSEEGFRNKYMNDPFFNKGFAALVQLFMQAKSKLKGG